MAFCGKCGAQLHDNATFCAACGTSTGPAATTTPTATMPVVTHTANGPAGRGFFSSLFDFGFTSFVTGKLIKVLYVLAIIVLAVVVIAFVVLAQNQPSPTPMLAIILAPIGFFLELILVRVQLEILIVIFRMYEHVAEIARQGR